MVLEWVIKLKKNKGCRGETKIGLKRGAKTVGQDV